MNSYLKMFKKRDFTLLTIADAVSVLGDQIGWVALLWFATVTTSDPATVGMLGLAFGLPSVFLGAVVGNVLDRFNHKMVLVIANAALGVVFTLIPFLYSIHNLTHFTLIMLVFIAGCLTPFITIGWMVVMPNLVDDTELGEANSVVETIWHGASLLGPLLAGILIARFGSPLTVLADGISFWIAAIFVLLLTKKNMLSIKVSPTELIVKKDFWRDIWNGIKLLYDLKAVWWITLGALVFTLAFGQLEVSLPLFTHHELSKSAFILGTFWTTYFVASLFGAAISGLISKYGRNGIWMALMAVAWGISFLPFIWIHSMWNTYMSMALAGFVFSGYPPLARTNVQRLVPKEYQGRIFGIRGSIIAVGMPIGSYLSGTLGKWIAPSSVMGYTGVMIVLVGLLLLSIRSFRSI